MSPRSNPAVIFGSLLLPSIAGRSSFHNGPLEPVNLCRPKGYCLGGRPSHLIFVELRRGELRRISLPPTRVNKGKKRKGPNPLGPRPRFADWLFRLAALLRLGPLVLDIVLDPPGTRLLHFLGGGLLAVFSFAPASTGCLVQLVPDVVLNCSLGHILSPPFFRGAPQQQKTAPSFRAALPSKQNPNSSVP